MTSLTADVVKELQECSLFVKKLMKKENVNRWICIQRKYH